MRSFLPEFPFPLVSCCPDRVVLGADISAVVKYLLSGEVVYRVSLGALTTTNSNHLVPLAYWDGLETCPGPGREA